MDLFLGAMKFYIVAAGACASSALLPLPKAECAVLFDGCALKKSAAADLMYFKTTSPTKGLSQETKGK